MDIYTVILTDPETTWTHDSFIEYVYAFSPSHAAQRAQISKWLISITWMDDQDLSNSCDPGLNDVLPEPMMISGFYSQPDDFPVLHVFAGIQESLY